MSTDRQQLLFEGFLKKRKDTMKMKWSTYWFRLQNTTLFFYTKKHGSASHLRGLYYIYTVQSVREIQREKRKHYVFEITMKNGKRKVLAAETADLRREWIGQLWRAMHLSGPGGTDPGCIRQQDVRSDDLKVRGRFSTYNSSECDSMTEPLGVHRPLSAPLNPSIPDQDQGTRSTHCLSGPLTPDQDLDQGDRSTHCLSGPLTPDQNLVRATLSLSLSDELSSEEAICQNTISHYGEEDEDSVHRFRRRCEEERDEEEEEECKEEEDQYDILPAPRNSEYHINQSDEDLTDGEDLYDFPLSNRRASDRQDYSEMTESIYDVPSSLMRKMSEHTLAEPYPGGEILVEDRGLLDDMMASLGGGTVGWITGASTGSVEPYGLAHHGS
ncbi:uncharacterized protein isoform X1 [Salmo salar]|uniref:Uncharacterized protein isoform X1 n=1 Tax=Salmo salar TaxID=8030 RepID=A0A1S3S217_SALSA|nr:uncharacterized protein LOC106606586 isoform X1 [Salmo salar]|eukprot:XP_014058357.1 PREDICTED: uncharacterized protein LOC106606586 isoform X1 [Salmo salar]